MGLPSLFSSAAPDSPRKLFLAILVSDAALQAALWEVVNEAIVIVERSNVHFYKDLQSCVVQADKALQELGKQSENVDEIIFGLDPNWVDSKGILEAKKPLLKKITDDLSLKAVGFVVTVEALAQDPGTGTTPTSCIFVELSPDLLQVSVIRQGKLLGSEQVGRSGQTVADVTEALARFKHESEGVALPTTFSLFSLLASETEMSEAEQAIISHDWVAAGILTQPPLVEIADPNVLLDVITRQGGQAVAQSLGLLTATDKATGAAPVTPPTSFGIPMPEKMAASPELAEKETLPEPAALAMLPDKEPLDDEEDEIKPSLWSKLPFKGVLQHPSKHPFILGGFVLGLLTVLIGGYAYLSLTSQATVAIQLKTSNIAQDVAVTLDPTATAPDPTALVLPAQQVTVQVTGSDSTAVSGTKLVGDPAKGTVTLFNKTTASKTFAAGTVLKSGKYTFTLDAEVSVASASVTSASGSETKTFGKGEAKVTAAAIGEESNLPANTEFSVASFDSSTYSATSNSAFAGGASREVRVVSAEDRSKLETAVKTALVKEAESQFKSQTTAGEYVVPTGRMTVKNAVFSAKVGEEVNQLTLDLTAEAEGLKYSNSDLQPLAAEILASQVPAGQELVPEALQMLSSPEPVASASSKVKLSANVSSQVRPAVTADEFKQSLAGQSLAKAQESLKANAAVHKAEFLFRPPLAASILRRLPPANRLQITIK